MAEDEKINTDIDDWLNDLEDEDGGAEELDQADIDSLLGSDAEAATEKEAEREELGGELDQSDLDNLLGDSGAEEGTSVAKEEETIDQEEMDRLFGSSATEQGAPGDEVNFAEILGDQENASPFSDFDADTFSLEPEEDAKNAVLQQPQTAVTSPTGDADEQQSEYVAPEATEEEAIQKKPLSTRILQVLLGMLVVSLLGGGGAYYYFGMKSSDKAIIVTENENPMALSQKEALPQVKLNHKPAAIGNLYQLPARGGEVAIQLQAEDADGDPLRFELLDPPSHGRLSGKAPSLVYLPNAGFPGRDSFTFRASDGKDIGNEAVIYITGPDMAAAKEQQGAEQISQVKKMPTEIPANDAELATTGNPLVTFNATGQNWAATIEQQRSGEPIVQKKKKPVKVLARDAELTTTSSESLIIDWLALWKQADNGAANRSCGVEVKPGILQGTLSRLDEWHYRYQPPKFFQGQETVFFRFKRGKKYSTKRLLTVKVSLGDSKPEIVVAPLAPEYFTGQTVTIDARKCLDEKRDKLQFVWQQLTGVPVKLKAENPEGSVVSFVMPSFFAVDSNNDLTIQLIAIDAGGKRSSRDIHFRSLSRRQQALWTELAYD